jgi:hypothetical protein
VPPCSSHCKAQEGARLRLRCLLSRRRFARGPPCAATPERKLRTVLIAPTPTKKHRDQSIGCVFVPSKTPTLPPSRIRNTVMAQNSMLFNNARNRFSGRSFHCCQRLRTSATMAPKAPKRNARNIPEESPEPQKGRRRRLSSKATRRRPPALRADQRLLKNSGRLVGAKFGWRPYCNPRMQRDPLADEPARVRPIGHPKHHNRSCFRQGARSQA